MDPVTIRLKRLREEAGISIRGLAEQLEMVSSTYAAYEDPAKFKKPILPLALARRIADRLGEAGIDPARVLELAGIGTGGALQLLPEEMADRLDAVLIPEVEVRFSMGGGSVIEDWPVIQMVPMSRAWLRGLTRSPPDQLMIGRGEGDSMYPTIQHGELVIIDRAEVTPKQQDCVWAMSYGGLGMIKRLRQLPDGNYEIRSDNQAVSPIHAADGELAIVGRVVGVLRKI